MNIFFVEKVRMPPLCPLQDRLIRVWLSLIRDCIRLIMGAFQAVLTNSIDKAVVAVDNCLEVYTLQEVTIKEFRHVVNDTHDASTAMTQIEVDVGIVAQDGFLVFDILEHRISSNANMVAKVQ